MQNILKGAEEKKQNFEMVAQQVRILHGEIDFNLLLSLQTTSNVLRLAQDNKDSHEIIRQHMTENIDKINACFIVLDSERNQNVPHQNEEPAKQYPPHNLMPLEQLQLGPAEMINDAQEQQAQVRDKEQGEPANAAESEQSYERVEHEVRAVKRMGPRAKQRPHVERKHAPVPKAEKIKRLQSRISELEQQIHQLVHLPHKPNYVDSKDLSEKEQVRVLELLFMTMYQIDIMSDRWALIKLTNFAIDYYRVLEYLISQGPSCVSNGIKAILLAFRFDRDLDIGGWIENVDNLVYKHQSLSLVLNKMKKGLAQSRAECDIPRVNPQSANGFTTISELLDKAIPDDKCAESYPFVQFVRETVEKKFHLVGNYDQKQLQCQAKTVNDAARLIRHQRKSELGPREWQHYTEVVRVGAASGLAVAQAIWATLIAHEQPDQAACWYQRAIKQGWYKGLQLYANFVGLAHKQISCIAFNLAQDQVLSDFKSADDNMLRKVDFEEAKDHKDTAQANHLKTQFRDFYYEMMRVPLRHRYAFETDAELTQLLQKMGMSSEHIINAQPILLNNDWASDNDNDNDDDSEQSEDDDE